MTGVSLREYARRRKEQGLSGGSHVAVKKAIDTKRITTLPDGTIDPERADKEWARNTFAGQTVRVTELTAPAPRAGAPMSLPPIDAGGSDSNQIYLRARAVKETFQAKRAQLEYEELAGKLIKASTAGEYSASFSAIVGEALSAWPDRVTPLIAATMSEEVIHKILSNEVTALRRKVAKAIADAGF